MHVNSYTINFPYDEYYTIVERVPVYRYCYFFFCRTGAFHCDMSFTYVTHAHTNPLLRSIDIDRSRTSFLNVYIRKRRACILLFSGRADCEIKRFQYFGFSYCICDVSTPCVSTYYWLTLDSADNRFDHRYILFLIVYE
jgi:hypothetical protein